MPPPNRPERDARTAVILAAGLGSRLGALTRECPKCLTPFLDRPILGWQLDALHRAGFSRIVVVTGHCPHAIEDFLAAHSFPGELILVDNPEHATTNNACSLRLAAEHCPDGALIVECDLLFPADALVPLVPPDTIALAPFDPSIMDGTTASVGPDRRVRALHPETHGTPGAWKTVNLTHLGPRSWSAVMDRIDARLRCGDMQAFYEYAIADAIADGAIALTAVDFAPIPWVEIDTPADLARALSLGHVLAG